MSSQLNEDLKVVLLLLEARVLTLVFRILRFSQLDEEFSRPCFPLLSLWWKL